MYHSISDTPHDPFAIHPDVFESQMDALVARGEQVIGLEEALYRLRQWKNVRRMVVVTFDDA
jgi:peptidoglycan/xylan/chitin deacetylase (PgdA/CDA1 family)